MKDTFVPATGDRSKLTYDELRLLEDKILPTARRWCKHIGGLRAHGVATLGYWGEAAPDYIGPLKPGQRAAE